MSEVRPPSAYTIEHAVSAYQRARQAFEEDGELAADEAVIARALDLDPAAISPDMLLRRLAEAAFWADARADEARAMANALKERQVRYTARGARLRAIILEIMAATDRPKFATAFGSVGIRHTPPSVVILDLDQLPDEYVRIRKEADKRKLGADLKEGVVIPGAVLSNAAPTVAIYGPRGGAATVPPSSEETTEE
jgi:hypothetical protein